MEVKLLFYEKYLQPFINDDSKIPPQQVSWFCNKAWSLRILQVDQTDLDKSLFIQEICFDLYKDSNNSDKITECLNAYIEDYALEIERLTTLDLIKQQNLEKLQYVQKLNEYYKTCFETWFRLFFSVPYLYVLLNYPISSRQIASKDVVRISAKKKYSTLSIMDKMVCRKPNFFDYITWYDNSLRNQWWGHDRYYVDNNDNIVYSKVDDETGKTKKTMSLTIKELEDTLRIIEKNLLLIDVGIALFIANSDIDLSWPRNRQFLQREIQDYLAHYAEDLSLEALLEFTSPNKIDVKIKYAPRILWMWGQLLMGNWEMYDMIVQSQDVTRKEQILWIMHTIWKFYSPDEMPNFSVNVFNDSNDELGNLCLSWFEVSRIITESKSKEDRYEPILMSWNYPRWWYKLKYEVRMPSNKNSHC